MPTQLPHPNIEPPPGAHLDDAALHAKFAEIQHNLDALALGGPVTTPWVPATLESGFVNYEIASWDSAGYRKVAGVVFLRGLIAKATATGETRIFYLPPAFRPARGKVFYGVGAVNGTDHARVDVRSGGQVVLYGDGTHAVEYLSLAPISFPLG